MTDTISGCHAAALNRRRRLSVGALGLGVAAAVCLTGCGTARPKAALTMAGHAGTNAARGAPQQSVSQDGSSRSTPIRIRIEKTAEKLGRYFAGEGLTRDHLMVVYVTRSGIQVMRRALRSAGIPRAAYRLVPVAHSWADLEALTRKLAADETKLAQQGIHLAQWGPDAASNTVLTYITGYSTERAATLENDYGGEGWITVKRWTGPRRYHY